jgi:predicted NAD-dependent protein-ADP-ribosyltransferase YbiA (DUF1768 family)
MAESEQPSGAAASGPVAPKPEPPPLSELNPYSTDTRDQIKKFFKKRTKRPADYTFTAEGNLKSDDISVNLLRYVPLDSAYRDAQEQTRLETIAELEATLVTAGEALRAAWISGSIPAILRANQEIADLEARRAHARSAMRIAQELSNPVTRDILFDQPYETRKLNYESKVPFQYYDPDKDSKAPFDPFQLEIVNVKYRDFPSERFYGRYVPDSEVPKPAAADPDEMEFRHVLKDGRKARIVFDAEDAVNGFLSPMWPVEFVVAETRFFTAYQAYEVLRAKELGNDTLAASLLKTRSVRMMRVLTQKVTDHPADTKGMWVSIYTALYEQHPELQAKLIETGADSIVYADARPGPSGAGVSKKDAAILDAAQWKGENLVGLAQEQVRSQLREGPGEAAPATETDGVITEAEQARARTGAIINTRRGKTL